MYIRKSISRGLGLLAACSVTAIAGCMAGDGTSTAQNGIEFQDGDDGFADEALDVNIRDCEIAHEAAL